MLNKFEIELADGKYTYIFDNGKQSALRYGEPWREDDLCGDNLVYAMARRIEELEVLLLHATNIIEDSGVDFDEAVEYREG